MWTPHIPKKTWRKVRHDVAGNDDVIDRVISVSLGLFVAATIVPVALVQLANASVDGVDPAVVVILTMLLPILAIVSIAVYFYRA